MNGYGVPRINMDQWQKNQKIALIHRQYEQRLDEWKVKTKTDEMATVINGLRQNPQGLLLELMNFKLVRSYPGQVGERVLGKRYHLFRKLPLDLNDLRVERQSATRAILEIEFFLQESSKIEKEANNLLVRIRYQFLGREYVQDMELPITIKSMVQQKTDIDELF